jgi:hypothetical protein
VSNDLLQHLGVVLAYAIVELCKAILGRRRRERHIDRE